MYSNYGLRVKIRQVGKYLYELANIVKFIATQNKMLALFNLQNNKKYILKAN